MLHTIVDTPRVNTMNGTGSDALARGVPLFCEPRRQRYQRMHPRRREDTAHRRARRESGRAGLVDTRSSRQRPVAVCAPSLSSTPPQTTEPEEDEKEASCCRRR
jgi:hypothetical protein